MYLLLDIGGTNTRITTSPEGQSVGTVIKCKTEQNFASAVNAIAKQLKKTVNLSDITATVVALPGVLNKSTGQLVASPNLPRWINQPIQAKFAKITNSPVHIVNDADLGGLGEAVYGAGQDYNIMAYLTISTGVGGVRIVNKRIDSNVFGFEPGFQIVDAGNALCPDCKRSLTLEDLVGGASFARRFNTHPKNIKDPKVWDTAALWLSYGLNNVIAMLSPEAIILGGPMMRDIPIEKVRFYTKQNAAFVPQQPAIILASLGDDRAFYGALAYIKSPAYSHLNQP